MQHQLALHLLLDFFRLFLGSFSLVLALDELAHVDFGRLYVILVSQVVLDDNLIQLVLAPPLHADLAVLDVEDVVFVAKVRVEVSLRVVEVQSRTCLVVTHFFGLKWLEIVF